MEPGVDLHDPCGDLPTENILRLYARFLFRFTLTFSEPHGYAIILHMCHSPPVINLASYLSGKELPLCSSALRVGKVISDHNIFSVFMQVSG